MAPKKVLKIRIAELHPKKGFKLNSKMVRYEEATQLLQSNQFAFEVHETDLDWSALKGRKNIKEALYAAIEKHPVCNMHIFPPWKILPDELVIGRSINQPKWVAPSAIPDQEKYGIGQLLNMHSLPSSSPSSTWRDDVYGRYDDVLNMNIDIDGLQATLRERSRPQERIFIERLPLALKQHLCHSVIFYFWNRVKEGKIKIYGRFDLQIDSVSLSVPIHFPQKWIEQKLIYLPDDDMVFERSTPSDSSQPVLKCRDVWFESTEYSIPHKAGRPTEKADYRDFLIAVRDAGHTFETQYAAKKLLLRYCESPGSHLDKIPESRAKDYVREWKTELIGPKSAK